MKYTNNKRLILQQVQVDQSYVEKLFSDCNWLYFDNKLPVIPIKLINSATVNGNFNFDVDFNTNQLNNMFIEINAKNKRTRSKLIATMVHEMLHYKVALEISESDIKKAVWYFKDGQQDKFNELMYAANYAHTGKWLDYANTINNKYKLNINLK